MRFGHDLGQGRRLRLDNSQRIDPFFALIARFKTLPAIVAIGAWRAFTPLWTLLPFALHPFWLDALAVRTRFGLPLVGLAVWLAILLTVITIAAIRSVAVTARLILPLLIAARLILALLRTLF